MPLSYNRAECKQAWLWLDLCKFLGLDMVIFARTQEKNLPWPQLVKSNKIN